MTDQAIKNRILARRRQFILTAMASAGVACNPSGASKDPIEPEPPVEVYVEPTPVREGGIDSEKTTEKEESNAEAEPIQPQVCLKIRP